MILAELLETTIAQRKDFEKAISSVKLEIEQASIELELCFKRGNKLLICGNGGSAADAQHMAAEFVGRFEKDRAGLPALALTVDTSALTAIGNDWSFDYVFRRQLEALGRQDDVILGISTSGKSRNILDALAHARVMGLKTIGLVGQDGGDMFDVCDVLINVGGIRTPIIQERQLAVEHIIAELVEDRLRQSLPIARAGDRQRIFCFDIDDTICMRSCESYDQAQPYLKRIAKVNALYEAGHKIIFFTARGSVSGIDHRVLTENQLQKWGVKYHELRLGKPQYDVIVDDKALNDYDFFGMKE